MNIDFKEPFFRFIFPACLLWSLFIFFDQSHIPPFILDIIDGKLDAKNVLILIILFITIGFVINSIGNIIVRIINNQSNKKPAWHTPESELNYWRKLALEKDSVREKIDRRWNFYTTYVNSFFSVLFFLIYNFLINNLTITIGTISIGLLIIFFLLGHPGYKSTSRFGDLINNGEENR